MCYTKNILTSCIFMLFALGLANGCAQPVGEVKKANNDRAQVPAIPAKVQPKGNLAHEWLTFAPEDSFDARGWNRVDKESLLNITVDSRPRATDLLRHEAFVPITDQELLQSLTGQKRPLDGRSKAVLVRCVAMDKHHGVLIVRTKDGELWCHFGFLGQGDSLIKSPVVVLLESLPRAVYITVEGAK